MSPPPHLSFDIQVEIIKKLPVKSLIQFRSVCKAWKSLIDNSQFIAGYNFRHDQSEHLLVRYDAGNEEKRDVKYVSIVDDDTFPQQKFAHTVSPLLIISEDDYPTIIGSSHGLFCFYANYFEGGKQDVAVLWNPSIKKSIAVVFPNMLDAPSLSVFGFGVCPATNDPKLVKITISSRSWETVSTSHIPCQVMVFSVSSKEWKYPCNNLPRKSILFTRTQTTVGKFIYWVAYDRRFAEHGTFRDHYLIMSFDISTEEFREVNLPDSLTHFSFCCFSISRLKESLALLQYTHDGFTVWLMEHGDPKLFTKLYTIKPPQAASTLAHLWFRKSGQPIGKIYDDDDDNKPPTYVVYEPFLQHVKDLEIFGNICYVKSVDSYTESLLLLDHDDGHVVRCGDVK